MVTAVWQCQNPHQADPRSALQKLTWPTFAPEKQEFPRVTHTRPHALAHAVNDRTDMPRRGQLEPAARAAHALGRCASEHTSGVFSKLRNFNFLISSGLWCNTGGSSPRPEGPEGAYIWLSRRSRFRSLSRQMCANRSLRGNGLKPAPDVGGVGHSCDLPLGHSCDLPLTSYRSSEIVTRSRYWISSERYEAKDDLPPDHFASPDVGADRACGARGVGAPDGIQSEGCSAHASLGRADGSICCGRRKPCCTGGNHGHESIHDQAGHQ